eukprot:g296.t1
MVKNKQKILELSKGFQGRAKNCFKLARARVHRSLQHAYASRRLKKRDIRAFWIQRINSGTRHYGVTYSQFMWGLDKSNILLNRKMLANLSLDEPYSFRAIVGTVHSLASLPKLKRGQFGEVASVVVQEKREIPVGWALNYRSFAKPKDKDLLEECKQLFGTTNKAASNEEEEGEFVEGRDDVDSQNANTVKQEK